MKFQLISNKHIITAQQYLILSIPFLLITGPFLSDLSLTLSSIFFLVYSLKSKNFKYLNSIYFKIYLVFYIYIVLNSLFSDYSFFSLKSSATHIRFALFSLSVWLVLEKRPKTLEQLFFIFIIIYTVLTIDGLKQFFTKENFFGMYLAFGQRVSSFFGDEPVLGSYLARFFPLFFAMFIYIIKNNKKKIYFYVFGVIFLFLEFLVFATGERTALFLLNLCLIYLLLMLNDLTKIKLFICLLSFVSILVFITVSFYFPASKIRIIDQTLNQIGLNKKFFKSFQTSENVYKEHTGLSHNDDDKIYVFSKQYHNIYLTSLNIFNENKILGIGPKNFRNFCHLDEYKIGNGCSTHPHNLYFQFLVELGIIGFVILVITFLSLLYFSFKHLIFKFRKKNILLDNFEITLLSCFFISLWPIAPSGNFFNNWLSIIYFYPLGFLFWSLNKKKKYVKE